MSDKKEVLNEPDFEVVFLSETDNKTIVMTASEYSEKILAEAFGRYDPSNKQYSAYLKDGTTPTDEVTPELLDNLAESPQSNLSKILKINQIIRKYINKDDIIGKTVESIETNVNTQIKLTYNKIPKTKNEMKKFEKLKDFIDDFNKKVNIKRIIRNSVPVSYSEGTYVMYLRHKKNGDYVVDYYPLGVVEISDYDIDGNPVVLFNIQELRKRLYKIYKKNKKNKALFFDDIDEEVKANYPEEVYNAFIEKEKYAKLDVNYTGVIRIGNLNRKYGLSPIFRALKPTLMLETFENSDRINSKAKAKKIIFQKLRKEVLGTDYNKKGFEEMAYAHDNFMQAWKQQTVVVTAPAQVEDIKYVEPKIELTDVDTVNNYRSKVLSTLGIGFLMDSSTQTVSTANITITQLLRTINKISEQLEDIIYRWYKQVLEDNGFDSAYAPEIQVIDSEALELDIKKSLAEFLFCKLNSSYETAFEMLGLSVEDEKQKRIKENEERLDEIFYPRITAYTSSGKGTILPDANKGGRPKNDKENDKQVYDGFYNKTR